jgi:hypothetical protein
MELTSALVFQAQLKKIKNGLAMLPSYPGTTWRACKAPILSVFNFQPGLSLLQQDLVSTTMTKAVATNREFLSSGGVVMEIMNHSSKNINGILDAKSEEEVIFCPNTKFCIEPVEEGMIFGDRVDITYVCRMEEGCEPSANAPLMPTDSNTSVAEPLKAVELALIPIKPAPAPLVVSPAPLAVLVPSVEPMAAPLVISHASLAVPVSSVEPVAAVLIPAAVANVVNIDALTTAECTLAEIEMPTMQSTPETKTPALVQPATIGSSTASQRKKKGGFKEQLGAVCVVGCRKASRLQPKCSSRWPPSFRPLGSKIMKE